MPLSCDLPQVTVRGSPDAPFKQFAPATLDAPFARFPPSCPEKLPAPLGCTVTFKCLICAHVFFQVKLFSLWFNFFHLPSDATF